MKQIRIDILQPNDHIVYFAHKHDKKLMIKLVTGDHPVYIPDEADVFLRLVPQITDLGEGEEEYPCFSPEDDAVYIDLPEELIEKANEWESSVHILCDGGVSTPPFTIVTG